MSEERSVTDRPPVSGESAYIVGIDPDEDAYLVRQAEPRCTRQEPHAECVAINHYRGGAWTCFAPVSGEPRRLLANAPERVQRCTTHHACDCHQWMVARWWEASTGAALDDVIADAHRRCHGVTCKGRRDDNKVCGPHWREAILAAAKVTDHD